MELDYDIEEKLKTAVEIHDSLPNNWPYKQSAQFALFVTGAYEFLITSYGNQLIKHAIEVYEKTFDSDLSQLGAKIQIFFLSLSAAIMIEHIVRRFDLNCYGLARDQQFKSIIALILTIRDDDMESPSWRKSLLGRLLDIVVDNVNLLIATGLDLKKSYYLKYYGEAELIHAVKEGDLLRVRKQIKSDDFEHDTRDDNGYTALMWAIIKEDTIIVELLIKIGFDTQVKDNNGNSPLMLVDMVKNNEIKDLLIESFNPLSEKVCNIEYFYTLGEQVCNAIAIEENHDEILLDEIDSGIAKMDKVIYLKSHYVEKLINDFSLENCIYLLGFAYGYYDPLD